MSNMYVFNATGNTTLDFGYNAYLVNASGGNLTLTLPIETGDGPNFAISRIDNTGNTVTINPQASHTVNGASTVTLGPQDSSVLVLYGGDWFTISGTYLT